MYLSYCLFLENGAFFPAGSKYGIGSVGEATGNLQLPAAVNLEAERGYPEKPKGVRGAKPRRWKKKNEAQQ